MNRRKYNEDGSVKWVDRKDRLDREDGPAQVTPDGTQVWCRKDAVHRKDGPAYVGSGGTMAWWEDGRRHQTEPYDQG